MTSTVRGFACALALAPLGFLSAARADPIFQVGYFNCDPITLSCSSSDSYGFQAIVGIDTVYAPDGVTVLQTLTDLVIESALGPTIANQIATDPSQPPQLQANLGPFTTLSDLQFAEDNQFSIEDPTACPQPPTEMLTQGGNLITGVTIENLGMDSMGNSLFTSPNIFTDLTGAVSGATVTSDTVINGGNDVYSHHTSAGSVVCGTTLPAGYSVTMVQSVVINTSIEDITETEVSSVPEPALWPLMLIAIATMKWRRMR